MWKIVVLAMLAPATVHAEDWVVRDGDVLFDQAALSERLIGQDIVFYDNGRSEFTEAGVYAYTYDGGGTALGTYEVGDDSTVCVAFQNGFQRCDLYVQAAERLVVITEKGERFPVRP